MGRDRRRTIEKMVSNNAIDPDVEARLVDLGCCWTADCSGSGRPEKHMFVYVTTAVATS